MVQPINYMLDVADPIAKATQGFGQGLQLGSSFAQAKAAKEKAEADALAQQQMQNDLGDLANNPSADGYRKMMTMYPQLSENLKRAYDTMSDGDRKQSLNIGTQVFSAIKSNQPQIAKDVLSQNITAYENSGRVNEANSLRAIGKMIDIDPKGAQTSVGLMLAATDPDRFSEIYGKIGGEERAQEMQPYNLAEKGAQIGLTQQQAEKTKIEAEWIPKTSQANISNIESQIEDRTFGQVLENKKIENQNRQFYESLDQNQKQFLMKLDQTERGIANKLNPTKPETPEARMTRLEQVSDFESASTGAKIAAKNASDLAANYSAISESTGGYWNKAMRNIPGTSEQTFSQKLETLKSQVFLTQVEKMRGMGALTQMEGMRLEKAIASLDADLDPKALQSNLKSISSELNRAATKADTMAALYATRGTGYSNAVVEAAKKRGVSPYEMQKIANEMGY